MWYGREELDKLILANQFQVATQRNLSDAKISLQVAKEATPGIWLRVPIEDHGGAPQVYPPEVNAQLEQRFLQGEHFFQLESSTFSLIP